MIAAASQQHGATLLVPCANAGPDGGTVMTIRAPDGGVLRFVYQDDRHTAHLPSEQTGR